MNKLLLNNSGRNHIKFFPMNDTGLDLPESEAEQIEWCKAEFKKLQHSTDAQRLIIHKNVRRGYLISVWELQGLYYLIICLRNSNGTYNDTIYVSKTKDDMIAIAKFMRENVETIMADFTKQLLTAQMLMAEQAKEAADA